MKVGIVILSRFNSSRLPGKALIPLNGKPILSYIVERLLRVVPLADIVIATSVEQSDDPIEQFAKENGVSCFRGSLENVAERFYNAAASQAWDFAVRINGDNIFVDTEVLATMIKVALADQHDFISNVKNRTFPKGMSIEIVRVAYYRKMLAVISSSASYREHVTLYLYEHDASTHYHYYNTRLPEASGLQMALDTKEDLERTGKIFSRFTKSHWSYNLSDIFNIWKSLQNE